MELKFEYVNWKGARKIRTVKPIQLIYGKTPYIDSDEWLLEATDLEKQEKRLFVMKHILRFIDIEPQRFLCVTIYVLNNKNELLMINSKKFNKWTPPGGKVDNNETPDEAAIRECFEETGIKIHLIGNKPEIEGALFTPFGSKCNVIQQGVRDHVDLIYVAKAESNKLKKSDIEASDIGWFQ